MEVLRQDLAKFGMDKDAIEKALYHLDEKASESGGKSLTSRQKRRTLMDENFSMTIQGKNGAREVAVSELWEDNLNSIVHAYNKQMSGAVAFGTMRVENPKWKVGDPAEERYIVDGIHSAGDWDKFKAQIRAHDVEVRQGDMRQTVEREIKDLDFAADSIRGIPNDLDRTRLGQWMRIAQNANFVRLMSQAGFASIAEFGKMLGEFGIKNVAKAVPGFTDFMRDVRTGKLLRDEMEDLEYAFTMGTDFIRGAGTTWRGNDAASSLADGANRSASLDGLEQGLKKASRYVSAVTLVPVNQTLEVWSMKAALASFRNAAENPGKKVLSEQKMRIIGLDAEMQSKVLKEIQKHDKWVYGENGRKVRILGLEHWEPQTRSAFEHAVSTWTRRVIQQNDLGQMNAVLGHPVAKVLFQFRNFTIGAWSKQTLAMAHTRELGDFYGFLASMMLGSMAYAVQTRANMIGLSAEDQKKKMAESLSMEKVAASAFQRAGASSLLPGAFDMASGVFGFEPVFNTRSTGQPVQGLVANPTIGMIDGIYGAAKGLSSSLHPEGHLTSGDVNRALRMFGNFPLMVQGINAASSNFPSK